MLRGMEQCIAETDGELLLKIKDGTAAARLQVLIVEIILLLNDLFQSLPTAANARDPLTSALSRRFPLHPRPRGGGHKRTESAPHLLMLDVDHFSGFP